ncbi:WYL domain-containing protein [Mesorhizobium sp. CA18]|uniref:WYL domain-containing protein n=1 Tax=unclassified Mesorhizobium TaxID=325217 RepID=UPI001CC930D2|nr:MULTISPECIES: WYL domain-containing protein [unclassified Mesorhizobium]MBZ9736967.1 WYL domain-containing protein [Mesorhizobium sp. CA9]MBZ9827338.1 WYL domain-containing protein [Mesorhizobium sp. CA18]MBZ9832637.1 WYL domain-containing protein [Mesorhizobium sp. CA2]MBZ9838914.1 WYL domain-containing protein [Mesorhizobium sp. CA3]MBZ9879367.1 WYL domain-containing protein [Mesorhizobium sp. Ca11]
MRFIDRAALWTGQVGRRAVAATFDVSVSHVTSDFHRYREMAPSNLRYDVAEKCFRPTDSFKPLFGAEDTSSILSTIAASVTLPSQDRGRLLGFTPPVDVVQALPVAIDQPLLVTVCRAITAGAALDITYQSMATPDAVRRLFMPRAMIFTGQRWLVRGWDGRHQAYRDLALARILSAAASREAGEDLPRDDQWHDCAALEISLIEGLSPGQVEVTAREFGMRRMPDGGFAVRIEPRQAMIPYVLDHLRLRPADHTGQATPIWLRNYGEIREFDRPGSAD